MAPSAEARALLYGSSPFFSLFSFCFLRLFEKLRIIAVRFLCIYNTRASAKTRAFLFFTASTCAGAALLPLRLLHHVGTLYIYSRAEKLLKARCNGEKLKILSSRSLKLRSYITDRIGFFVFCAFSLPNSILHNARHDLLYLQPMY